MALTQTLLQLRTRLRELTDTENDTHLSDAELTRYINSAITYVYDKLVISSPSDYFLKETPIAVVAGTDSYVLPTDFYKLRALYVQEQPGYFRPVEPCQEEERMLLSAPTEACTLKMEYIPCATPLALDEDTFDGINGWEELVLQTAAIDVKNKREEDSVQHFRKRQDLEKRISRMAFRDAGAPERVIDRNVKRRRDAWYFGTLLTRKYRLQAGNIRIYEQRVFGR
jgi:hypothetical protein